MTTPITTALVAITCAPRPLRGHRFALERLARNVWRTATMILLTLLAFSVTSASSSYAATLTVCASGCDYTTIAAAISAASAGDTISITDTVHTEANIGVPKI